MPWRCADAPSRLCACRMTCDRDACLCGRGRQSNRYCSARHPPKHFAQDLVRNLKHCVTRRAPTRADLLVSAACRERQDVACAGGEWFVILIRGGVPDRVVEWPRLSPQPLHVGSPPDRSIRPLSSPLASRLQRTASRQPRTHRYAGSQSRRRLMLPTLRSPKALEAAPARGPAPSTSGRVLELC